MTEDLWFALIPWIVMLLVSFKWREQYFTILTAFTSFLLGLLTMVYSSFIMGIIFVFVGFYLLFVGMYKIMKVEGKGSK